MLVVLVVVGLLTTMLMQGFGQAMDLRLRLGRYLDGTGQATLSAGFLRASLQGLVAQPKESPDTFKGAARRLSGLTLAARDGEIGTPTPFAWALLREDGRTVLTYLGRDGSAQRVRSWQGASGSFRFQDVDGAWLTAWPPAVGEHPALPVLIRLDAGEGDERWTLLAAPRRTVELEPGIRELAPGAITN